MIYDCFVYLTVKDERSEEYTGDGTDDFRGLAALKKNTGNWRACPFILGGYISTFLLCN